MIGEMTKSQLYDLGYAIPGYGLHSHYWTYREECIELRHGSVPIGYIGGWPCAKWVEVVTVANLQRTENERSL